jgi:thiosulfate dehydrogenase [quinone] large subunit
MTSEPAPTPSFKCALCGWSNESWAFLILRLWLAMRAFLTGLQKYAGTETREIIQINEFTELEETVTISYNTYGPSHYHAVPDSLKEAFAAQPLLPDFLTAPYYAVLGPALLVLGITLLLGVCVRTTLVLMGLLYISLTFGLILINQDGGIAWLGTHILLVVAALVLEKHKRLVVFARF